MDANSFVASLLRRKLRANFAGVLIIGERDEPVRFVIDGATGRPALPVHADVPDEESVVLLVPDRAPGAIELMGAPADLDPVRAAVCDVHAAHFGRTSLPRWILLDVEAAKFSQGVCEGSEVAQPDPIWPHRAALCRALNADRAALADACERLIGLRERDLTAVNVDASGISIRFPFDILRLEFNDEVTSIDDAQREIDRLVRKVTP